MELPVLFKILGDDTRLRIIGLLLKDELCVCDIESVLEISQANASRHLGKMKSSGILSSRKKAQWIYYSINKKLLTEHPELIEALASELKRIKEFKNDIKSLASLKKRKSAVDC